MLAIGTLRGWVHIRCCGKAYSRLRPYGASLLEGPKRNQKVPAPPLGASLWLGMPARRHCSVGPPRSAIHGRVAANPASCRVTHCAIPACGQRGLTGRLRSKTNQKLGDPPTRVIGHSSKMSRFLCPLGGGRGERPSINGIPQLAPSPFGRGLG